MIDELRCVHLNQGSVGNVNPAVVVSIGGFLPEVGQVNKFRREHLNQGCVGDIYIAVTVDIAGIFSDICQIELQCSHIRQVDLTVSVYISIADIIARACGRRNGIGRHSHSGRSGKTASTNRTAINARDNKRFVFDLLSLFILCYIINKATALSKLIDRANVFQIVQVIILYRLRRDQLSRISERGKPTVELRAE